MEEMSNVSGSVTDGGAPNEDMDSLSKSESPTDHRARRRDAMKRLRAIGIEQQDAVSLLADMDRFLPDIDRLTTGASLDRMFEDAFAEMQTMQSALTFRLSKAAQQDAFSDTEKYFRDSKTMQRMISSESDLMYAMGVLERDGAALLQAAVQRSILRSLMQAELVRRRALAECWKYNLPKTILAFHSVLHVAGLRRDDLRVRMRFFSRFVDLVVEFTEGRVDRSVLMEAANEAEDLFSKMGRSGDESAQAFDELNSSGDLRKRLSDAIETMPAGERRNRLLAAYSAGAGLDSEGRLIFESIEAFSNCVKGDAPSPTPKQATVDDVVADEAKPPKQLIEPELAKLPAELEAEVARAKTIRSSMLATSRCERPFDAYRYSSGKAPFQFMPLRDRGPENDRILTVLKPTDFVRLEVGTSGCEFEVMPGRSAVLGRCHELMLPTEPSAALYGSKLGWPDTEARELMTFGSASRPEKFKPGGDWRLLHKALRGVASLQLRGLANVESSHLLAADEKANEAAEDLSRWWMFVMFVRLNPEKMMAMFPPGFLHGVHGPDVAIEDGKPVMGDSHIRIIDPAQERLELNMTDEEIVAKHGPRHIRRRLFDKV